MTRAEVVGTYPVQGVDCYLVEVALRDISEPVDLGGFTQPEDGIDRASWQAPYMEWLLDESGEKVLSGPWLPVGPLDLGPTCLRVAFHLHFLDPARPLASPFGFLDLPTPTDRPAPAGTARV